MAFRVTCALDFIVNFIGQAYRTKGILRESPEQHRQEGHNLQKQLLCIETIGLDFACGLVLLRNFVPLGMKGAWLIDSFVSVSTKVISLSL